jgi:hypothetical protein
MVLVSFTSGMTMLSFTSGLSVGLIHFIFRERQFWVKGAETNIEYMKGHLSRAKIGFQLSF